MRPLSDAVVVVTGGARGIGKNIALEFARRGSRVHVCDRDGSALAATAKEFRALGHEIAQLSLDLAEPGAAGRMVQEVVRKAGRIDVLVNNAQSTVRKAFLDETDESWDAGMTVTLKAAFFAAQEATRAMSKSGGGAIVNIGSVAAFLATHESPVYHAAKAGLVQITRYLAVEAGKVGVRVNCVSPAFIVQDEHQGRFTAEQNAAYREMVNHCHPLGAPGRSDQVAQAVAFLCAPQSAFVNGQNIVLDGGATVQDQFCLLRDFTAR
jgi:NAD(P)-dependent dehydrogenase (short-subunit alcohol dehydrogenase family)